ncbi:UNVERIFIED_CONTAM: hypothetical protein HDU68_009334 [Siphonaria sp. JEL0065]|nr:hypothetical protein HDU68_009334 [Siphonaria sp. JEL0065]
MNSINPGIQLFSTSLSSPTYFKPPSSTTPYSTASLFAQPSQMFKRSSTRRPALARPNSISSVEDKFRIQQLSRQNSLASTCTTETLRDPKHDGQMDTLISSWSKLEISDSKPSTCRINQTTSQHTQEVSTRDIFNFIESVRHLVCVNSGSLEIPDEQMGFIRATVFSFYDLVYDDSSSVTEASQFCLKKLPEILCNLQLISRSVNKSADSPIHIESDSINERVANASISASLTRCIQLLQTLPQYTFGLALNANRFMDKIEFYWMRQRICSVIVFTLGNKLDIALKELGLLIQQTSEAEKRDSAQTLVGYNRSDSCISVSDNKLDFKLPSLSLPVVENEAVPNTYLIYTGKTDAFLPVPRKPSRTPSQVATDGKETLASLLSNSKSTRRQQHPPQPLNTTNLASYSNEQPQLKSAIARMPASAISPGDMFIILSGYQPDESNSASFTALNQPRSVTVPKPTSLIPAPPSIQSSFKKASTFESIPACSTTKQESGFDSVALAKLVSAEHLFPGYSKLTVSVLKEKDSVGFRFGGGGGVGGQVQDWERLELENRVKDALKYGAVRVESELFDGLF